VTRGAVGDPVAVNPSVPCVQCRYCLEGKPNQCLEMRFYGSAMRTPHIHGGFREQLTCQENQLHLLPPGTDMTEAAFAEPLSVCDIGKSFNVSHSTISRLAT
jgi:L-idonate 5-dehydrogenase